MAQLVWLITGTTSGLGAALVRAVADRGDLVIATGRDAEQRLLPSLQSASVAVLDLDVRAPRAAIRARVDEAIRIFGRVDVLINNAAGAGALCAIEEASGDVDGDDDDDDDGLVSRTFDTGLFGAWHVTQAILPHMRARARGGDGGGCRIGFVGSGAAWAPMPFAGAMAAAKAALACAAEALEREVGPLGVHAVCFELGGFPTRSPRPAAAGDEEEEGEEEEGKMEEKGKKEKKAGWTPPAPGIEDYQAGFARQVEGFVGDVVARKPGDVARLAEVMVDVIKGEGRARGRKWPVRLALGPDCEAIVSQKCKETLSMLEEWKDVSRMTARDDWDGEVSPYLLKACSLMAE